MPHASCPSVVQAFDQEADVEGSPPASPLYISDYRHCRWPGTFGPGAGLGADVVANALDQRNEREAAEVCWVLLGVGWL